MGLFDFLKSKDKSVTTPATPTPSLEPDTTASAAPAGPRYKGSSYTAPAPPVPPMPEPMLPPMPPMPDLPVFEPTNILEELLLRAANEPEIRPPFYQALLGEEVLLITAPKEGDPLGEVTVEAGTEIQLQMLHDGKIPVFTSQQRIYDNGSVEGEISFLRMRGADFFQMVQGADCALNPFSAVGKLLPADELADLLAGKLTGTGDPDQGPQVMVGQPAEQPVALIEALGAHAATQPFIQAIYLAQLQMQDSPEPPRLLLAFLADTPDPAFLQELAPVMQDKLEGQQFVDLMLINPTSDEPLNHYFQQIEPIYRRQPA